jgi:hypothetical protein
LQYSGTPSVHGLQAEEHNKGKQGSGRANGECAEQLVEGVEQLLEAV